MSELERLESARKHTQEWYARHYGKLEDWARKRLPEPWRTEFFNCVANGTWGHEDVGERYTCVAGFEIVPTNYFRVDTAEGQLILDQTKRAEDAELENAELRADLDWLESRGLTTDRTGVQRESGLNSFRQDDVNISGWVAWYVGTFKTLRDAVRAARKAAK